MGGVKSNMKGYRKPRLTFMPRMLQGSYSIEIRLTPNARTQPQLLDAGTQPQSPDGRESPEKKSPRGKSRGDAAADTDAVQGGKRKGILSQVTWRKAKKERARKNDKRKERIKKNGDPLEGIEAAILGFDLDVTTDNAVCEGRKQCLEQVPRKSPLRRGNVQYNCLHAKAF